MSSCRLVRVVAILLILGCTVPGISAYVISGMNINPPGNQPAGTPMTVTFAIKFPRGTSNVTFPQDSDLHLGTDLTGARWSPVMVLDGMTTKMDSAAGKTTSISGWYLSYPSYQDLELQMTLKGAIPENPAPSQDLVKIEEVDSTGYVKSSARVAMPEAPLMAISGTPPGAAMAAATAATTIPKKPVVRKTLTQIPIETTTEQSPLCAGSAIFAIAGAVVVIAMRR